MLNLTIAWTQICPISMDLFFVPSSNIYYCLIQSFVAHELYILTSKQQLKIVSLWMLSIYESHAISWGEKWSECMKREATRVWGVLEGEAKWYKLHECDMSYIDGGVAALISQECNER